MRINIHISSTLAWVRVSLIPFNAIRGMRNRVVHKYKEIDVDILWEVTQTNIPELLNQFTIISR